MKRTPTMEGSLPELTLSEHYLEIPDDMNSREAYESNIDLTKYPSGVALGNQD